MRIPSGAWLRRPIAVAVLVPLLAAAGYGGVWAVTGEAPFFAGSSACPTGTPSGSASPAPSGSGSPSPSASGLSAANAEDLSLLFDAAPEPLEPGGSVSWSFTILNNRADAVTLTFGSGQSGEVTLTRDGTVVYRWSAGKAFTQAVREVTIQPGDTHEFVLQDTLDVPAGIYELTAIVTSDPSPAPERRTVTVGGASPSPTASASPASSGGSSPSPSGSPTGTGSSSPTPTQPATMPASPSPTATTSPRGSRGRPAGAPARRGRSRRSRRLCATLALVATLLVPFGAPAFADDDDGEGGGKNVVALVNTTEGREVGRAKVKVSKVSGPNAVPQNIARAFSRDCTGCRTVAVALQTVIITNSPTVAAPRNIAVAVNLRCTGCHTFAYAYQYVVTIPGAVTITPEGKAAIRSIRERAITLADSNLDFPTMDARLDALAAELRSVIDNQVRTKSPKGDDDLKTDREDDDARQSC